MARLMAYSSLTGEDRQIGPDGSLDDILGLTAMLPLDLPSLIVHVEGVPLQKWGDS